MQQARFWISTVIFGLICHVPSTTLAVTYLNVWHKEESEQSLHVLNELLSEFASTHNTQFDLVRIDPTDLTPTLLKNAHEGTLPDVAFVPADLVGHYKELGLSKVSDHIQNSNIEQMYIDTATIDGATYAAPILGGNHLLLYYNKKYVDKPAETWADIRGQMPEFEELGVAPIGWFYSEPFWLVGFIPAFNGQIITDGQLTIDTPEIRRAFEFYKALSKTGFLDRNCDYSCGAQKFYSGEVAYAINGDWALEDGAKALGKDFGVALLPKVGDRTMRPMFSTTGLIFPDKSLSKSKKKTLLALIKYMQSETVQRKWFSDASRFPVHQKIFDEVEASTSANQRIAMQQLRQSIMMPNDRLMAHIWQGLRKAMSRYLHYDLEIRNILKSSQRYITHQNEKNP